ncbi:MAG: glycoside hydrolase family 97 N-terminal domain-containing protein, partial [Bacteroidota bacterium]|nr:glycoside hydrolase family 97 N-terminal domain-containing protein [Bacteroidota bacterium]
MNLLHRIFNVRSLLVAVICSYGWLTPAFASQAFRLTSPDGKITVSIKAAKALTYAVIHEKDTLLNYSTIALTLSDGTILGKNPVISNPKKQVVHETIPSPFYRSKQIVTTYGELNLSCKGGFGVIFRAYNDGVAYRFYTIFNKEISIQKEQAEFNFCQDFTVYLPYTTNKKAPMAMAFQNTYDVAPLSKTSQDLAFLPVTVACQHGKKLTILESDLESYPGMFVQAQPGKPALKGVFAQLPSKTDYY